MRQGNAALDSTLSILIAAAGFHFLRAMPRIMGSSIRTIFCIRSLLAGMSRGASVENPANRMLKSMMNGMVKTVMMLVMAVSETDRATSPPAILEKMLEELPPGEQAISMMPVNITGSGRNIRHRANAMRGRMTSVPRDRQ